MKLEMKIWILSWKITKFMILIFMTRTNKILRFISLVSNYMTEVKKCWSTWYWDHYFDMIVILASWIWQSRRYSLNALLTYINTRRITYLLLNHSLAHGCDYSYCYEAGTPSPVHTIIHQMQSSSVYWILLHIFNRQLWNGSRNNLKRWSCGRL